jgi:hypothetical protein
VSVDRILALIRYQAAATTGDLAMFKLKLAGGVLVLALLVMGVRKVNHAVSYEPAVATLTSVSSECQLLRKRTHTTGKMPCPDAERLKTQTHHAGTTVVGLIDVGFTFVSPVDNATHSGALRYAYEDYDKVAGLAPGSRLPILAHKADAEGVAHDYEDMGAFATTGEDR